MLALEAVTKRFGGLTAVRAVSLEVPAGELLGIIGPNGAGKTTLFNVIAGYYRPDEGRVRFDGRDITGQPPHHGENDVHTCLRWAAVNEIPAPRRPIPPHLHELRDIALRAMSTIPEDRHRSAEEFAAAIKSARRHGESQRMAERATRLFDQARVSGAYEDYARAIFSFEESQAMWGGNRAAHDGAVGVRLAYAEKAMERGDLDLAASMLDEGEPAHTDARSRLAQLRAQRPPSGPVEPKHHG